MSLFGFRMARVDFKKCLRLLDAKPDVLFIIKLAVNLEKVLEIFIVSFKDFFQFFPFLVFEYQTFIAFLNGGLLVIGGVDDRMLHSRFG